MDDPSFATAIASIVVALIAAFSARASQRSAKKASVQNEQFSVQAQALKDSYERARAFDTDTITRQGLEIERLNLKVSARDEHIEELEGIVTSLRIQVATLVAKKAAKQREDDS